MDIDVEHAVDNLARRLGAPLVVADRQQRLIAYSAGHQSDDPVRITTILDRVSPKPMRDFVQSQGLGRCSSPVRLPENRELGSRPRVCIPLKTPTQSLGHVWALDVHGEGDGLDLEECATAAENLIGLLVRQQSEHRASQIEDRQLVAALVDADPDARRGALSRLELLGRRPERAEARTVLFDAEDAQSVARGADPHGIIAQAARLSWPASDLLVGVSGGRCLMVLGTTNSDASRVKSFLSQLADVVAAGSHTDRAVIGVSSPHSYESLHKAFGESCRSLGVAHAVPELDQVGIWDELGALRALSTVEQDQSLIDPVVLELIARDSSDSLVATLECYFSHAGDIQATAAALAIHRTSLYYRLKRVEEIVGASLRSGDTRLAIEVGLKLARLHGLLAVNR